MNIFFLKFFRILMKNEIVWFEQKSNKIESLLYVIIKLKWKGPKPRQFRDIFLMYNVHKFRVT